MLNSRSKLVTAAAVGAAAIGGATIANAATGSSTTPSASGAQGQQPPPQGQQAPPKGGHTVNGKTEKPLSGSTASKVRAAALAKVSGTVERVETNVDSSAPYEAHIRKADGAEVEVQVTKDFKVAAVNEMGQMGGRATP